MNKTSNLFGRYVWLVDTLRRHKRLTYAEINQLWTESGLSYGADDELPLRTFHNHCQAISEIFDVYIECDIKHGYKYYIVDPERLEGDSLRTWLIDSYSALNQIHADQKLEGRIIFENVPSGSVWLTSFTNAIRNNLKVEITYQGFGKGEEHTFEIEPYYLKIFNQRWYVIGKSPYYAQKRKEAEAQGKPYDCAIYRVYALDRIINMDTTRMPFTMDEDFDINEFYDGCCGIIPSEDIAMEHIIIRSYYKGPDYLRSLPIHSSQTELSSDDESTLFSYDVRPTFDFYQKLLAQADQLEVVSPASVRNRMKQFVDSMQSYYHP